MQRNWLVISRRVILGSILLGLNWALFAPAFVCSVPAASFWPTPDRPGLLGWLTALFLRRANQDVFRVSIDFGLMLLCLLWSGRAAVRRAVLCAYGLLWIFLAYHHAVGHWFQRTPALVEDLRLGLNLLHFLGSFAEDSQQRDTLVLAAFCAALWLLARAFAALQAEAAGMSRRTRARLALALLVPAAVSCASFGVAADAPVLQLASKRMYANYLAVREEAQRMAAVKLAAPDTRYDALSGVRLAQRPDVTLVMMEAYGEILATSDMAPAQRELLARVEERLVHAGYHAASAYSAAPVHGGTSWFSIASVLTGVHIHRPREHALLKGGTSRRVPTLTRFFREQGYTCLALQPGAADRPGLPPSDLFGHDDFVDATRLAYTGPPYGFGGVPDQYALGVFRALHPPLGPAPRYTFYMNVSTHYPWGDGVPRYVRDYRTLTAGSSPEVSDVDASWPALRQAERIATPLRRSYFQSIAYEWRLLTEWFEAESDRPHVIVVVGDHQPRLEWDLPGMPSMNTPLHVLSNDRALVEGLVAQGFQPGMYAEPGRGPQLRHEGLFSLLVSQLAARFGSEGSPRVPVYPNGAPLSALKR